MIEKRKKELATIIIVIIILGIIGLMIKVPKKLEKNYETGELSIDELLGSKSERSYYSDAYIVSDENPFYPMIATPAAQSYGDVEKLNPLLVYHSDKTKYYTGDVSMDDFSIKKSSAVERFFSMYNPSNITIIGEVSAPSGYEGDIIDKFSSDCIETLSLTFMQSVWNKTDAVIIIENSKEGFAYGILVVPVASYLNIPVVVLEKVDEVAAKIFSKMGVKYSIVCGNIKGYGKTMHFKDYEETEDLVIAIVNKKFGEEIRYIVMANPLDSTRFHILDSISYHYSGMISSTSSSAYPGAAPTAPDGPMWNFTIPEDYTYAEVVIDIKMDLSETWQTIWARDKQITGERIYCYIGKDENDDGVIKPSEESGDILRFFGGSPGYDYVYENPQDPHSRPMKSWFYTRLPFFNDTGTWDIQLIASLVSDPDAETSYTLDITVNNLEERVYPFMKGLSSMAPYLAAYHHGIVLARSYFSLYDPGYVGCVDCGEPASNKDMIDDSNNHTGNVKKELNRLLGKLANLPYDTDDSLISLADYYRDDPVYIGIIADTNMIPQYYYHFGYEDPAEGYGLPSDNIYSDIDASIEDAPFEVDGKNPSLELPIGRIVGWDVQDVSALIARTIFYYEIIDTSALEGHDRFSSWKDCAMNTVGSAPPVGSAYAVTTKLNYMWREAGFNVDSSRDNEFSRRQFAYRVYERSNFIMFCAHGFYYWYVPTVQEGAMGILPKTYGGGAFDVTHVRYMNFGPSVVFGSSCVTGRIDGLYPYNALSQAFLHAGVNAYIGATRVSYGTIVPLPNPTSGEIFGDYIALLLYGHLVGYIYDKHGGMISFKPENVDVGTALILAKNKYIDEYGTDNGGAHDATYLEFILHGDPAFNPYEPNHEG